MTSDSSLPNTLGYVINSMNSSANAEQETHSLSEDNVKLLQNSWAKDAK